MQDHCGPLRIKCEDRQIRRIISVNSRALVVSVRPSLPVYRHFAASRCPTLCALPRRALSIATTLPGARSQQLVARGRSGCCPLGQAKTGLQCCRPRPDCGPPRLLLEPYGHRRRSPLPSPAIGRSERRQFRSQLHPLVGSQPETFVWVLLPTVPRNHSG
jgi:hypothetical protein